MRTSPPNCFQSRGLCTPPVLTGSPPARVAHMGNWLVWLIRLDVLCCPLNLQGIHCWVPFVLDSTFSGADRKLPGTREMTYVIDSTKLLDLWSVVSMDGELLVSEPKCVPLVLGS